MDENSSKKEHVVVGWGLAGAVLSWQLYFRGEKFQVYDSLLNHSTRVAAGLVNPIVFKRLTKSWNADLLLPYADEFYTKVEKELGVQLVSRKSIYRVFASIEEENNWASKEGDDRFNSYLTTPVKGELPSENQVSFPFGIGKVLTIGCLDPNLFLDESKTFFERKGVTFIPHSYDYNTTITTGGPNHFYCEGVGVRDNPLFNYLPFKPTHGEILIIKTDQFSFDHILNKKMFIKPLGDNKYLVGATYNWEINEPIITKEAKLELIERLNAFTNFEYTIVEQKAGIRPTVSDRRPLLGRHPDHENSIIFNGLGTKGVMIAPYYAGQLVDSILEGGLIDPEVDIKRYQKHKL